MERNLTKKGLKMRSKSDLLKENERLKRAHSRMLKENKQMNKLYNEMLKLLDDVDEILDRIDAQAVPKTKQGLPKVMMPRDYYC